MIKSYLKNSLKLQKEDGYLVFIFILVASAIFLKSFFSSNGYISNDSTYYLSLAQNLLEGNGFYTPSPVSVEREFFSIWPIGYPFLIYLFAKLTGVSVFVASKFLNVIFLGFILVIMRGLFKKNSYLYGLLLLSGSLLNVFSQTWSETAFIFGLVWFAASLYKFVNNSDKLFIIAISLFFSSLFLFLSRYIGAFSFGLVGLFGIYFGVKKNNKKYLILIVTSCISLLVIMGYLYHNFLETGFITGTTKQSSMETNSALLINLSKASFSEIIIHQTDTYFRENFIFLAQYALIGFLTFKYRKRVFRPFLFSVKKNFSIPFIFGLTGITYLFSIVVIRWNVHLDSFGYRFLAPGFFLIFIAGINYMEKNMLKKYFNLFKLLLIFTTVCSWIYNVPLNIIEMKGRTYIETVEDIKTKYQKVERNSIVIFGSKHLNYLYTGLTASYPCTFPQCKTESWSEYFQRIDPENKRTIYLEVPVDLNSENKDTFVVPLTERRKDSLLNSIRKEVF